MAVRNVESTLDTLVIALCLDYFRRQKAIEERSVTKRTDTEFRYYNFRIFAATAEIVGERMAEGYIKEIGNRTGFAQTEIEGMSEITYKNYKRLVKNNIAKKLHLRD